MLYPKLTASKVTLLENIRNEKKKQKRPNTVKKIKNYFSRTFGILK